MREWDGERAKGGNNNCDAKHRNLWSFGEFYAFSALERRIKCLHVDLTSWSMHRSWPGSGSGSGSGFLGPPSISFCCPLFRFSRQLKMLLCMDSSWPHSARTAILSCLLLLCFCARSSFSAANLCLFAAKMQGFIVILYTERARARARLNKLSRIMAQKPGRRALS